MPTVARFSNCRVSMYAADHNPPHFHVRMSDGREALVGIATLEVIRGDLRKADLAEPLAWAAQNTALLVDKWTELNP